MPRLLTRLMSLRVTPRIAAGRAGSTALESVLSGAYGSLSGLLRPGAAVSGVTSRNTSVSTLAGAAAAAGVEASGRPGSANSGSAAQLPRLGGQVDEDSRAHSMDGVAGRVHSAPSVRLQQAPGGRVGWREPIGAVAIAIGMPSEADDAACSASSNVVGSTAPYGGDDMSAQGGVVGHVSAPQRTAHTSTADADVDRLAAGHQSAGEEYNTACRLRRRAPRLYL